MIFRGFRPRAQKRAKKEPPGRPKWSPNRPPEPLGRVKSRWEILPEPPRKFTMNFFRLRRPPGAIWEPPGTPKKGFHVALLVFSASGRLRGAILEPFWLDFGAFFGAFLKRFGGKLKAALGAVLAAVPLGLLWFLWSPRVAAARNFPKASPGSSRKAARKPQENSGKRSQL